MNQKEKNSIISKVTEFLAGVLHKLVIFKNINLEWKDTLIITIRKWRKFWKIKGKIILTKIKVLLLDRNKKKMMRFFEWH